MIMKHKGTEVLETERLIWRQFRKTDPKTLLFDQIIKLGEVVVEKGEKENDWRKNGWNDNQHF